MAYWSSTIDIWEFEDDMNKGPEDRYHDSKTGEFVTDEQGKSDPAGTVLVDHKKPLTPWMEEWIRLGEMAQGANVMSSEHQREELLNAVAVQAVIHIQVLKQ